MKKMKREDSRSRRVLFPSTTDRREERGGLHDAHAQARAFAVVVPRGASAERGQRTGDGESDARLREISDRCSADPFFSLHEGEREGRQQQRRRQHLRRLVSVVAVVIPTACRFSVESAVSGEIRRKEDENDGGKEQSKVRDTKRKPSCLENCPIKLKIAYNCITSRVQIVNVHIPLEHGGLQV